MCVKGVLVWYSQTLTSIFGLVNSSIKNMRLECLLHPSHSIHAKFFLHNQIWNNSYVYIGFPTQCKCGVFINGIIYLYSSIHTKFFCWIWQFNIWRVFLILWRLHALTAICSVKTLVGLFGNKGRPKLIKLLRFNFFPEIGEGGLKRTL